MVNAYEDAVIGVKDFKLSFKILIKSNTSSIGLIIISIINNPTNVCRTFIR